MNYESNAQFFIPPFLKKNVNMLGNQLIFVKSSFSMLVIFHFIQKKKHIHSKYKFLNKYTYLD